MPRQRARRPAPTALLAVLLAAVVAACGAAASPAPATESPGTRAPATQAPAGTGGFGFPGFTLPPFGGDPELEAMFPERVAGLPVQVLSLSAESFLGSGNGEVDLLDVLDRLGKSPSDLTVAIGGTTDVQIVAYRLAGVPAGVLFDALRASAAGQDAGTITTVTVGGKQVDRVEPAVAGVDAPHLYQTGEVTFVVVALGGSQAILDEVFSQLP